MQPTEHEIEQEREALRDIRRRSVAQVAPLDPDLPIPSSSSATLESDEDSVLGGDPSHLFWVPAHVHPELAPGEFRAFLKDHANLARTKSSASTSSEGGVSRKRSMLSRQYRPGSGDMDNDVDVNVKPRRRSTYNRGGEMTMTIEQLQKLEDAASSGDPNQLRTALRRSMSLGAGLPYPDETDEDPNAPIPLVNRPSGPGQIVRRAARTKIRKPGVGTSLNFQTQRRGSTGSAGTADTPPVPQLPTITSPYLQNDVKESDRPLSFSEETSIFDSYSYDTHDGPEPAEPQATSGNYPYIHPTVISSITPEPAFSVIKPQHPYYQEPSLHPSPPPQPHAQPQPQPQLYVPPPPPMHRSPSPPGPAQGQISPPHSISPPPVQVSAPSQPQIPPPKKEKEKEKKASLFGFGSKKSKSEEKSKDKDKEKDRETREKEDKDSFLSSLFSSRKKQPSPAPAAAQPTQSRPQVESQQSSNSLLATGSVSRSPSPSVMMNYARYPIHVERAVYRLSHIKLANPRRALLEQVLISNLMFWYLGVINRTGPGAGQQNSANQPAIQQTQQEAEEEDEAQQQQQSRPQIQQPVQQYPVQQPAPPLPPEQPAKSGRRTSLTRPDSRSDNASRRAETPIRSVNYEAQARSLSMEGEYGTGEMLEYEGRGGRGTGWLLPQRMQQGGMRSGGDYVGNGNGSGRPNEGEEYEGMFYYQPPANPTQVSYSHQQRMSNGAEYGGNFAGVGVGGGMNGLPPGAMMPLDHTPIPGATKNTYDYRDRDRDQEQPWTSPAGGMYSSGPTAMLDESPHSAPPHARPRNRARSPSATNSNAAATSSNQRSPPRSPTSREKERSPPPSPPPQVYSQQPPRSHSPPGFRSPSSPQGHKLQGRSLSASAVPANPSRDQRDQRPVKSPPPAENTRLRKKSTPASPRPVIGDFGGSGLGAEDEDVPLAFVREGQRRR